MPSTFSPSDRPDTSTTQGDRASVSDPSLEIHVCQHKTCRKDGSAKVLQAFEAQRSPEMAVVPTGCMGNCGNGPMVRVWPDQVCHSHVRSRDVAAIVAHHLQSERGERRDRRGLSQDASQREPQNHRDHLQPPLPTSVFWPSVALGLALLIALGSILGTALLLG